MDEEFELPDGSYSVSDIQGYNPPIRIYINKIENRITFENKTEYYLELLTPETINYLEALKVR